MSPAERPMLLVIGAGPRLGAAIASRFARDGYDIALLGRSEAPLAAIGAQLRDLPAAVGWSTADVADAAALRTAIGRFVEHTGRIDVVVHNVSVWRDSSVLDVTPEQLAADLAAGAGSLLTVAQAVVPVMRAAGRGTILATGSAAADAPSPGAPTLGPQKAALRALTQSLAAELTPDGIHCATLTINGFIAAGGPFDPHLIADAFATLAAETAGPPAAWRTVVPFPS